KERRRQIYAIAIVAIIALLGINVWLMMSNKSKADVIVQQEKQLDLADSLRSQLDEEYQLAMQQLDAKAAENGQLQEIVDEQKEQLRAMKKKIERNISKGATTTSMLKEAQSQIQTLVTQKETYIAKIEELTAEKADLTEYTEVLKTEKSNLEVTILEKEDEIAEVVTQKAKVEEEKENLSKKVSRGGVLSVRNMNVQALKIRRSGKEKETSRAKYVEKFNICFDVIKNELTEAGRNKFLLRIINPVGETIAVEQRGSGTFSNQEESGTSTRFTKTATFDYNNEAPNICIDWIQEEKLANKGEYTFEIYNRGYLAGSKVIKLK
ncbi:MAG: hypothetical protein ACPG19_01870, partial [Saprospiraceae bacterium]